jgi:hypothetical protein
MNKKFLATTVATLVLSGIAANPVFAADSMSAAPDCANASMMMQSTMPADHAMAGHAMAPDAKQSVDASYLKSMKTMLEHQSAMAKMEVACGKDPAVKAHAKKSLDAMQPATDQIDKLLQSIAL